MEQITRKSLLYKSAVEYADFCLNHVEGCSHGCVYPCYAFLMKKRCGVVKTYEEWLKPKLVSNAMELLDREIPKLKNKIKSVHLCFSTDPFMYGQDEVVESSSRILKKLNENDLPCEILTKGIYPEELAHNGAIKSLNDFGISLVSLDDDYRKKYEPHAAPFEERIVSLRKLHDKGMKTWVSMEPYPTPNIWDQDLKEILRAISFVDRIVFGKLNYNRLSTSFEYAKDFYLSQIRTLKSFCKKNKIECYIKKDTKALVDA
jgi:DNA repair photolyase